ncbi:hypothetical protein BD410DRAFT_890516 [Rickenella mellea]|uniref:Uncharacterized protein n=1 Tax=Rickenella mellea TaxID=50990 RepID=A0A4Y7PKM2_9AGAM|nr:hypothetical protein BD410DRAFT_890516 [Rickenella mellea]
MTTFSTLLVVCFLPSVLSAFTQNACWPNGCVQKASNGKFCYYPYTAGTDASCSSQSAELGSVLTAHLAQGHSIAYYGPDNVFVGDVSWPYPPNAGITYLCASGSINGAYQSFCARPYSDNAFYYLPGPTCVVGLPMSHVDDGCYDPSLAVVNVTSTPSDINGITPGPSASERILAIVGYEHTHNIHQPHMVPLRPFIKP